MPTILVTGGCGFIGSALVRFLLRKTGAQVINFDKLTYAAAPEALAAVERSPRYRFIRGDICDRRAVAAMLERHRPTSVVHLAAETHVDRSIDGPADFIATNIVGTAQLLEAATAYWRTLPGDAAARFRFHHVSTDEVFGSAEKPLRFTEDSPANPSSPYAASKCAADHLVRAWHKTYGLPVLISNCSNNYGPWQFPEKLIPLTIFKALNSEPIPVYGDGNQVRDWIFVDDHARGLYAVLTRGAPGETYVLGGECEKPNIEVVRTICDLIDEMAPGTAPRRRLIRFVADRPGHDRRYATDSAKAARCLGWTPSRDFETGLRETIAWYLDRHRAAPAPAAGAYAGERLGLAFARSAP
jgi:dTDP-glucose 4,6-dehydratase